MAEVNFIDGIALDASYFGYTDFQTGLWRPKNMKVLIIQTDFIRI